MAYKLQVLKQPADVPVGTLIRFETVTVLLDPAWSDTKVSYEDCIKFWSSIIPDVDIILFSQSTADFLGAYPLLYNNFLPHFITRIHVYATLPITNLGRVTCIDQYTSAGVTGPYTSNKLDIEDIEKAFDHITALKYSQTVDLRSRYDGLSMTAYNAGYTPGSSIWCISNYSEKLLYLRNWNHTKSTILNAAALLDSSGKPLSALFRPSSVLTSFDRFGSSAPLKRRTRTFNDTLRKSLAGGGSLIIPCEVGGNFLELLAMTHNYLYEKRHNGKYPNVPILFVSYAKGRTVTYGQSMLEWLSSVVIKHWEGRKGQSPFDMNDIMKLVSPKELAKQKGSAICFVSEVESCVTETLKNMSKLSHVTILLTSNKKSTIPALNDMLLKWNENSTAKTVEGAEIKYTATTELEVATLTPLKDDTLEEFNKTIDERRQKRKDDEVQLRKEAKVANMYSNDFQGAPGQNQGSSDNTGADGNQSFVDDSDDDDDDDNLIDILKGKGTKKQIQEIPMDTIISSNTSIKGQTFQFRPKKTKIDEYGTFTNLEQLIPPTEDEDKDSHSSSSQKRSVEESVEDMAGGRDRGKRSKRSKKDIKKEKEEEERRKQAKIDFDSIDYLDAKASPCERTIQQVTTALSCQVIFLNLENIVDQRSATAIWPSMKPRRVLLIGSEQSQNEHVVGVLSKRDIDIVNIPYNEDIEFNTTIKAMDISIDPELDQLLRWQKIGEAHTVAHVVGRLVKETPTNKLTPGRSKLVLKPLETHSKVHTSGTLSIGDVRLTELRRKLLDLSHKAEFKGEGTLVVDGQVAVRKVNDGQTVIDGFPSDIFDIVKSSVTEMLAKV
ncbi:cleavage polyadenylation factor subunit [Maudiozyma humilis]|uniref:Cleavage and polyadenylation specificity factor subunit 2 n=1 Tax=Maudiozyma humilis TaxID=51915 RepID=A0AAV5RZ24_MAUHU|nr:cleavage polyadenylation factor subunit [Kazachstania humilis]